MAAEKGGFVKLISSDKQVFVLERRIASVSGRLRTIFSGAGAEAAKAEVTLELPGAVLEKVCQYFVRARLRRTAPPTPPLLPGPRRRTASSAVYLPPSHPLPRRPGHASSPSSRSTTK
jgi:hypothetical protein